MRAHKIGAWAGLGLTLLASACSDPPEEVVRAAREAMEARDLERLRGLVDPDYTDALGGREVLFSDLEDMWATFPRMHIAIGDLSILRGTSELEATAVGRLDAELVGPPTWRVFGPMSIELVRNDGFRIRSGLFTELRDIRRLAARRRAAIEANDASGFEALLHPFYRDGDLSRVEVLERLSRDLEGVRVRLDPTNYRLELRGGSAHLDEYYVLQVQDRRLPPQVARFMLKPTAGRWRIASGLYRNGAVSARGGSLEPEQRRE